MKFFITSLIFLQTFNISAQLEVKTFYESTKNGYEIFVDNNEICPISIEFKFKLTNLKSVNGTKQIYVIPAQSKKYKVTDLVIIKPNSPFKMSYETLANYGDHFLTNYDENYLYELPYSKGKKYMVGQGYNGPFSHQNQNAIDFTMPIGSDIAAARAGVVVKIVQKNNSVCAEKRCNEYNNFILILHSDGTFSEYSHIKQNGALVKKGDKIEVGQLIAKSGNVGWSNGPHLHFVVYIQRLNERITLKTKFITSSGQVDILEPKNEYEK